MKRKRKWLAVSAVILAVYMASGVATYAAEPGYTEEDLGEDEGSEQSFTMPVIVNATDHSESGKESGGNSGGKDDGGHEDSGDQGGDSEGSDSPDAGSGAADASQQTFIVTVTDRFVNRAGEEQLVSVRSIGKYRRGTYLLFSATKADGYTVSGEKLQSVTVENDTQIVFTYIENNTGNTAASGTGAGQTLGTSKDSEKKEQDKSDTVSGDETGEEEPSAEEIPEDEGQTDEDRRTPVIRRTQEEDGEIAEDTEEQDFPEDETEGKKPFHIPWWVWLIFVLLGIAAVVTALAMTGKLSYLWLLFLSRFFRNRWRVWHGLLTKEENRFIDTVRKDGEDSSTMQELIEQGGTLREILARAEESGDTTYLPSNTRIAVSYQDGGEYPAVRKIPADEETFYSLLEELQGKGEVVATFFNDPAEIEFALTFQL